MDKKGQFQIFALFIQVIIVLFFLGSGIGEQITFWTQRVITEESMTGLTAFILAYMNLWIIMGLMILVSIGVSKFGDQESEV